MIAEHLEPRGLAPTAVPVADTKRVVRREAAARGSRRLRDAILLAKGYPVVPRKIVPKFKEPKVKLGRPKGRPKGTKKVRQPNAKVAQIQALVAAHFNISVDTLLSLERSYRIVRPRQIAMFLARKAVGVSLLDIAHQFNDRDHTTVINAIRRVEQRLADAHSDTLNAVWAVHRVLGE